MKQNISRQTQLPWYNYLLMLDLCQTKYLGPIAITSGPFTLLPTTLCGGSLIKI